MSLLEKLQKIQFEMKAPKSLYNSFGKYSYRNAESILEAFKPYGKQYGVVLTVEDDIVMVGDRIYVKAIATLFDVEKGTSMTNTAFARESLEKKGMDDSQITGTASSYARKYALNGLFLLDDTKDADTDEYHKQTNTEAPKEVQAKVDEIKQMKIADTKVKILKDKCEQDGVDEKKLCRLFGIKALEDMTEEQFRECANNWTKNKETLNA